MESIPMDEAATVRKELAIKYFGREIDGTAHKDMSNLIADQMKSTTEMVKASTEEIKNLKGQLLKSWEQIYIEFLVRHSTLLEEMPKGYTVYVKYFFGVIREMIRMMLSNQTIKFLGKK